MKKSLIYQSSKPHLWFLAAGIIMSFVQSGISVYIADYVRGVTNTLTGGVSLDIPELLLSVAAAVLIAFAADYFLNMANGIFNINSMRDMKDILVKKLLRIKYPYMEEIGSGGLFTRFNTDINEAQRLLGEFLQDLAGGSARFLVTFFYMLAINWQLLLLSVAILPLSFWILRRASEKVNSAFKKRMEGEDNFAATARDILEGIAVERAYNLQEFSSGRVRDSLNTILRYENTRLMIGSQLVALRSVLEWTPIFICCMVGASFAFSGKMTAGDLVAFFLLLRSLSDPMQGLPYIMVDMRQAMVSVRRLDEVYNAPEESGGLLTDGSDSKLAIEWRGVSFGYKEEKKVLDGIDFTIPAGKSVALVGSSGSGKTTIFKLLTGLHEPWEGNYSLFGSAFTDWKLESARERFSLVSQDVFLFPETIAENVSYGRPGVTQEEIEECCRLAGIHDFIVSLSDGYQSQVGERGVKLSGGERQRISIARAFLKNAPILLLDEPTSALDYNTERIIQHAIKRLSQGKTVITIAHRLSTIQNADEIFVLDNGRIAERGSHQELLAAGGVYGMLYRTQSEVSGHE